LYLCGYMYVCLHACMWVYAHEWAELCIESRFLWMYMGVHLHSFMLCYVCVYLCFPERSEVLYTSRNRCPLQFHVRLCMCIFIFCQREVRCFILVGIDVHYFVRLCNAPTHIKPTKHPNRDPSESYIFKWWRFAS